MSTYSLNILDSKKYQKEIEESIIYSFEQYIYKEHFRLGNGIENENELKHNLILSRILCEDNCEIVNYIQDKLEGKLEIPPKKKKRKKLSELLNLCSEQDNCTNEEVVQKIFWTDVSW